MNFFLVLKYYKIQNQQVAGVEIQKLELFLRSSATNGEIILLSGGGGGSLETLNMIIYL